MNIENFKALRNAVARTELKIGQNSIMNLCYLDHCGTPSCLIGHSYCLYKKIKNFIEPRVYVSSLAARDFLGITNEQASQLFMPEFKEADYTAQKNQSGYITKSHVLRTLDLIINGETDIKAAWEKGV